MERNARKMCGFGLNVTSQSSDHGSQFLRGLFRPELPAGSPVSQISRPRPLTSFDGKGHEVLGNRACFFAGLGWTNQNPQSPTLFFSS